MEFRRRPGQSSRFSKPPERPAAARMAALQGALRSGSGTGEIDAAFRRSVDWDIILKVRQ